MGTQVTLPQRGTTPKFSAHICCGQMAAWIKMPLGMEIGLGPGDFVFNGDPAPPRKRAQPPPNSAHCGQTAVWIKMPLGTEVNLGPGDVVLDGVVAPPRRLKGAQPPSFHFMSIVAKWLDG